jgi:hypothetical protein
VFLGMSPRAMLEKTGRLWNRYYDQGATEVEFINDSCAVKTHRKLP